MQLFSRLALWSVIFILLLPVIRLIGAWGEIDESIWLHFQQTILWDLISNTLKLLLFTGIGVLLLGVSLAWLVTRCEFTGRKWLEWSLFLPFAMPAYVLAFVFIGLFDYAGSFQSLLRELFAWQGGVDIRQGTIGVALIMSLVFYPYVYFLARSAFLSQPQTFTETAYTLGASPWQAFWRVSLPLARPAIVAGMSLAMMEVLADFGTVGIFNYDTFTTAIYASWVDFRSLETAAQLSTLLLFFAVVLITLERSQRGKRAFYSQKVQPPSRYQLTGWQNYLAMSYLGLVVFLAFILPVIQLLIWAMEVWHFSWDDRYYQWTLNSMILAIGGAVLTIALAIMLNSLTHQRYQLSRMSKLGVRMTTLGYALPGSVLAVGVMLVLVDIQNALDLGIWLSSGLLALLFAYMVRFLAVAYGPIESGFSSISPSMVDAARTLGTNSFGLIRRIYLPLLRTGVLTAFVLVGLDILKELPATYLLRPFGWDTLAVRTYELSSEGLYDEAAIPALLLLLLATLGLWLAEKLRKP